jgi:hypothetical protein
MECGKGELPIGRPFRHAPQNGTLLGGSKKGAAAPFFFPSYRPAPPVGRGDFSERQRRKINSASVKLEPDENSSGSKARMGDF